MNVCCISTGLDAGLVPSMCHSMNNSCKSQPYCKLFKTLFPLALLLFPLSYLVMTFFTDLILTATVVFCVRNFEDIVCRIENLLCPKMFSSAEILILKD